MGIEIDVLALENWFDLLAFLSRPQLGQLASGIGNRRFASIVQTFLHKYVRQITLGGINLTETKNGDENDHSTKTRVNLWQKYRWGREEFPVADCPLPENITNFATIQLSYLDASVLRFMQIFQQNGLLTNVNMHIRTDQSPYKSDMKIAQCLSHLIPMIASIDSIEFKGCSLISAIFDKWFDRRFKKDRLKYPRPSWKLDYAQFVARMIDQARIIQISNYYGYPAEEIDWLCHWLYTPRDDQKAKCLLLLGQQINSHGVAFILKRIKQDFYYAKEAVSYFIGIQHNFSHGLNLPLRYRVQFELETLTNSQTNERMTLEKRRLINPIMWPNEPDVVLISRYPLDAAQEWIDKSEKELLEWQTRKLALSRRIEFYGYQCGIGPMEMENPPNRFRKLLSNLRKIGK